MSLVPKAGPLRALISVCALVGVALTLSCRPADQRTDTADPTGARARLSPALAAQLDSGTTAFRTHDFERALHHYRNAVELDPEEASAWFGIYMAERALGNNAAADSALMRVQEVAPGATLLRDTTGAP